MKEGTYKLKFSSSTFLPKVLVRMIHKHQLAVCCSDLFRIGAAGDIQRFIVVWLRAESHGETNAATEVLEFTVRWLGFSISINTYMGESRMTSSKAA